MTYKYNIIRRLSMFIICGILTILFYYSFIHEWFEAFVVGGVLTIFCELSTIPNNVKIKG